MNESHQYSLLGIWLLPSKSKRIISFFSQYYFM